MRDTEERFKQSRNLHTPAQLPESRLTGFIQVAKQHKASGWRQVRQNFLLDRDEFTITGRLGSDSALVYLLNNKNALHNLPKGGDEQGVKGIISP